MFDPLVQLGQRVRQLLLARRVSRQLELSLQFCARQLQRFNLSNALGVGTFRALARLPFLFFTFFHALGETGFRVDEPFSGITHVQSWFEVGPAVRAER
jgi:hypothetical protein